jgi:hypothetical protein
LNTNAKETEGWQETENVSQFDAEEKKENYRIDDRALMLPEVNRT